MHKKIKKCSLCSLPTEEIFFYNDHTKKHIIKSFFKYLLNYKKTIFTYRQIKYCDKCEFGELVDKPSTFELSKYYEEQYWKKNFNSINSKTNLHNFLLLRANSQTDFIGLNNIKNFSKMLDIGAGSAYTSLNLKKNNPNIEIFSIEESNKFEKYYFENNIKLLSKTFPIKNDINHKFDYIHLSHVMEHFLNLDDSINNLEKLINKNGIIFIEVPNCSKEYWINDIHDEPHVLFFSKKSIKNIFNKDSFEIIKFETCGLTWGEYIENYYKKNKPTNSLNKIKNVPNGIWLRLLLKKL